MDAQLIAVVVWVAMGAAGLAAGLAGLASTRRRIRSEVLLANSTARAADTSPIGAH